MSKDSKIQNAIKLIGDKQISYFYPATQHYIRDYSESSMSTIGCDAELDGCSGIDNNDPIIGVNRGTMRGKDMCFYCFIKLFESNNRFHPNFNQVSCKMLTPFIEIPRSIHILNYGYLTYGSGDICVRCKVIQSDNNPSLKSEMGELCMKCVLMLGRCLRPL